MNDAIPNVIPYLLPYDMPEVTRNNVLYLDMNNVQDKSPYMIKPSIYGGTKKTVEYNEQLLYFDGVDDYVLIPNDPKYTQTSTTVLLWIKINKIPPVAFIGNRLSNSGWVFDYYNGTLRLLIYDSHSAGTYENHMITSKACYKLYDGNWHQIGISYNAPNYIFWVDGIKFDSGTVTNGIDILPGTTDFVVGKTATGSEFFGGYMSDIAIYNEVLTEFEIKRLYDEHCYKHNISQANRVNSSIVALNNPATQYNIDATSGWPIFITNFSGFQVSLAYPTNLKSISYSLNYGARVSSPPAFGWCAVTFTVITYNHLQFFIEDANGRQQTFNTIVPLRP